MNIPHDVLFDESHEWVRRESDDTVNYIYLSLGLRVIAPYAGSSLVISVKWQPLMVQPVQQVKAGRAIVMLTHVLGNTPQV